MVATVITLEELGIIPTVKIEDEPERWFEHSQVVAAFKAHGLSPLANVKDLLEAIFNTEFVGFVPDEAFFTNEKPECPFFDVEEFYKSDFLDSYGGWQPKAKWLLEKL